MPAFGPGLPDAPLAGVPYVRTNGAWQRTFVSPGYVSGSWYPADYGLSVATSATANAGTIYFAPLVIYQDVTITDLAAEITTGVAASNFQLAIYAMDATTKRPIGAALATTPSMSAVTAAVVSSAITPVLLPAGLYWIGVNTDVSGVVYRAIAPGQGWANAYVGSATVANVLRSTVGNLFFVLSQTFGTWPTVTTVTETSNTTRSIVAAYRAQ